MSTAEPSLKPSCFGVFCFVNPAGLELTMLLAKAQFEFLIFLPSSPECWYYRHVPHLVYEVLGIELRT